MRKKLFFRNSANVNPSDTYVETLLPDIPFYGMKGTICRIEVLKDDDDRELCYYKVLYNHDGTIDSEKIRVPKCKGKNLVSLLNDYYTDLKQYLDFNNDKYLDYKTNLMNKKFDKRKVQIAVMISVAMTIVSLPILILTNYVGAIMSGASILLLYKTNSLNKKIMEDEKKHKFIKQYDQHQQRLVNYYVIESNQQSKKHQTKYTGISSKRQVNEKEYQKFKTKVLMKEELREAA